MQKSNRSLLLSFLASVVVVIRSDPGQKDGCQTVDSYYEAKTVFTYQQGCYEYECYCRGNNKWTCPEILRKNLCSPSSPVEEKKSAATNPNVQVADTASSSISEKRDSSASKSVTSVVRHVRQQGTSTVVEIRDKETGKLTKSDNNEVVKTQRDQQTSSRCTECVVSGRVYPGHSRFQYSEGCHKFNCICKCDGSYNCPAEHTENTCADDRTQVDTSCQECEVGGTRHPGNSYFSYTDKCTVYEGCACHCDGSWKCPGDRARDICAGSETGYDQTCMSCEIDGRTIRGNTNFSHTAECTSYTHCLCKCDGSWVCPAENGRDICNERSRCSDCEVNGKTYSGNSYFSHTHECMEYRDCVCRCSGQWECPAERGRNICTGSGNNEREQSSRCSDCVAGGNIHPGNSYFNHTEECIAYQYCICRCDGSWECPAERGVDICNIRETEQRRTGVCQSCIIDGVTYDSNAYFERTDGCIAYTSCVCNCDGSWECPASRAMNICEEDSPPYSSSSRCQDCVVDGTRHPGNNYFEHTSGCLQYSCICYCNGSWDCPEARTRVICDDSSSSSSSSSSLSSSSSGRSSSSSSSSDSSSSSSSSVHRETEIGECRNCEINGVEYIGNSHFNRTQGCSFYYCMCHCNGSWTCPSSSVRDICNDQAPSTGCSECTVHGRLIQANTYFNHSTHCVFYDACICRCNGSWECPSTSARNTCQDSSRPSLSSPTRTVGRTQSRSSCSECYVYGKIVQGNSRFKHVESCNEYNCECRCDGTWECPPERTRDICATGCSECEVYGQHFPGNSYFKHRDDCIEWECLCQCDGGWNCPAETAKDICRMNETSGCYYCDVYGRRVEGNSNFKHRNGCIEYDCTCECDGGWNCPGEQAKDTCKMNMTTGCYHCDVNGEIFQGNSFFKHRDGCILYECTCDCDGGWKCPGKNAIDTCNQNVTTGCYFCQVDGNRYQGQSTFQLTRNCFRWDCDCNCDGSWDCSQSQGEYVCDDTNRCGTCHVSGREIQGGSTFNIVQGCTNYQCHCRCDGGYICPAREAVSLCSPREFDIASITTLQSESRCKQCDVGGRLHSFNTLFFLQRSCLRFICQCNCDGSHNCTDIAGDACGQERRIAIRNEQNQLEASKETVTTVRRYQSESTQGDSRSTVVAGCQACYIQGIQHNTNAIAAIQRGCTRYTHCRCTCDGSWQCSSDDAINTCGGRNCHQCRINGTMYNEGETFSMQRGCTYFPDCHCNCDGTWECASNTAVNTCRKCRACNIDGVEYAGNSSFTMDRKCWQMNCICDCDGRSTCPSESAVYTCGENRQPSGGGSSVGSGRVTCAKCHVNGNEYDGMTDFNLDKNCRRMRCRCNCDGGWDCPQQVPTNICDTDNTESNGDACMTCVVDGVTYDGETDFHYERGCHLLQCRCNCNGTWNCHQQVPFNICNTAGRRSEELVREGRRRHSVSTRTSQELSRTTNRGTSCSQCIVDRQSYEGLSEFHLQRLCDRLKCFCNCDGSWFCPSQVPVNTCETPSDTVSRCKLCEAEGTMQAGDSDFYLYRNCDRFLCHCNCNGTWNCPTQTPLNFCESGRQIYRNEVAEWGDTNREAECKPCDVEGTTQPGNSEFYLTQGCTKLRCSCNCNGIWRCPEQTPINVCTERTQPDSDCITCTVNGQIYQGNSKFVLDRKCIRYHCTCDCNGSWRCPRDTTEQICDMDTGSGSSYTQDKTSSTILKSVSTGYDNVASSGTVVKVVDRSRSCLRCTVEGQVLAGGTNFRLTQGCLRKNCHCDCDGSWNCPSDRVENICDKDGDGSNESCRQCDVRGTKYDGNTRFFLKDGCFQYSCHCNCDGSWTCPGETAINTCNMDRDSSSSTRACIGCTVQGKSYTGNSEFVMNEGCFQYHCTCECNGNWNCPAERTVNVCSEGQQNDYRVDGCQSCIVGGTSHPGNTQFQYNEGCFVFQCDCSCDGSFNCPATRTRNTCGTSFSASFSGSSSSSRGTSSGSTSTGCVSAGGCSGRIFRTFSSFEDAAYQSASGTGSSYNTRTSNSGSSDRQMLARNQDISTGLLTQTSHFSTGTCGSCFVNDNWIAGGKSFTFRLGCTEFLCECHCDGSWECPVEKSVDICEGKLSPPNLEDESNKPRGCKVGNRIYFTKLFSYTSDCVSHFCRCEDNGEWHCSPEHARTVC